MMLNIPKSTKILLIIVAVIASVGLPYRYYQIYKSSAGHYIRNQVEATYNQGLEIEYDLSKAKLFGVITSALMVTSFDLVAYIFISSIIVALSNGISKGIKKKMFLLLIVMCILGIFSMSKGIINLDIGSSYFVGLGSAFAIYVSFSIISIFIYFTVKIIQKIFKIFYEKG